VTHHGFLKIEGDASVGGHKGVDDDGQSMARQTTARIGSDGDTPVARREPARRSQTGATRRCAWCGASATRLVRLQRWQQ